MTSNSPFPTPINRAFHPTLHLDHGGHRIRFRILLCLHPFPFPFRKGVRTCFLTRNQHRNQKQNHYNNIKTFSAKALGDCMGWDCMGLQEGGRKGYSGQVRSGQVRTGQVRGLYDMFDVYYSHPSGICSVRDMLCHYFSLLELTLPYS